MKSRVILMIYALSIFAFIQPELVKGFSSTPETIDSYEMEDGSYCNDIVGVGNDEQIPGTENQLTEYSNLFINIEYGVAEDPTEGMCKITLNGKIVTDNGTVSFDNVVIEVSLSDGEDCSDLAIKLLKSFQSE